MLSIIPGYQTQDTDRTGTTYRFENQKQQSMSLLQRVKKHLKQQSSKIKIKKHCVIDSQQLDQHVNEELNDKKYTSTIENDDINHQKLIDDCVREILKQNNPLNNDDNDNSPKMRGSQRSSFSQGKSIPKNRMKRLSSTILVGQMVKNKGLDKPTLNQIKQQQIDKMLSLDINRKSGDFQKQQPPKITLPILISKNIERETVTMSQRLLKTKKRIHSQDPSPLLEHHTSFSMISDSVEYSPKNRESHRRLGSLILQINNEKDEITTHQRKIKNSIFQNQKNYNKINQQLQPTSSEKYNYLKHEQNIFGKVRQRKLIL